jgi:hypothetical protein
VRWTIAARHPHAAKPQLGHRRAVFSQSNKAHFELLSLTGILNEQSSRWQAESFVGKQVVALATPQLTHHERVAMMTET